MKLMFRYRFLLLIIGLCLALLPASKGLCMALLPDSKTLDTRNIIFMVPDGMGLSNVTLARTYLYGPAGQRLSFESLPYIGYQRTTSRNSYVTDSAAAGSAWACGEKFNNRAVSCLDADGDGQCDQTRKNRQTILELAAGRGMATGLVATSDITHATPAAFGAHVHHRKCESEIFSQLIDNHIDVLLGGGVATNRGPCKLEHTDEKLAARQIDRAESLGYTVARDRQALENARNAEKLLGLFSDGGLTPVFKRDASSREPTLAEMTRCALGILEKEENGFFLMIEGSQIDWANHAREVDYLIGEMIDFDNAVKAVSDWIEQKPEQRGDNTLLIVVSDHETGGVILEGPYGALPPDGDTDAVDVTFASNAENPDESANHTAVDSLIWSNQPQCAGAMENTDLFYIMKDFLETD